MRPFLRSAANLCALVVALPSAVTCWIERRIGGAEAEGVFSFWTHVFSLLPGTPGMFLRRAFYRWTLDRCASRCFIGFGAVVAHRQTIVEQDVYIGTYALVGSAWLQRGCLIGSRASLLSGARQHQPTADGAWTPFQHSELQQIRIGEHAWIGEAGVVMADVGRGAAVSAGSVVSAPVPPDVVVAGNPARFVRKLRALPEHAIGIQEHVVG